MTTTADGKWCARCHHMIAWSRTGRCWVHVSDDDWAGPLCECSCTLQQARCLPDGPGEPRRGMRTLGQAISDLRYTLDNSARSFTKLAESVKQEDQP